MVQAGSKRFSTDTLLTATECKYLARLDIVSPHPSAINWLPKGIGFRLMSTLMSAKKQNTLRVPRLRLRGTRIS